MLRKLAVALMLLCFTSLASAEVIYKVESEFYKKLTHIPFDMQKVQNAKGETIYVVSEEFGMLHLEPDIDWEYSVQDDLSGDTRDTLISLAHQDAKYLLKALYNVDEGNVYVGKSYLGRPAIEPESTLMSTDIKFARDGFIWSGRINKYIPDDTIRDPKTKRKVSNIYTLYPYSR